ncbi:MAG: hypothetical protein K8W52_35840 [Deltaproteobacteria bacterium]|nr:hypothetical protein [Deltaproteobacteria bacterium]
MPAPTLKQAAEPPRARLITDAPDPETVAAPPQVSCPLLGPNPRWVHRDPPIYENGDRSSTDRTYYQLCDPVPFLYVGLGGERWARFVAYGGGLTFGVWTFYDGARELGTIDNADALLRANR